jgi:hypothetical protein
MALLYRACTERRDAARQSRMAIKQRSTSSLTQAPSSGTAQPMGTESVVTDADIDATIVRLLAKRAATSSICPSEAARALSSDEPTWRALMPRVRAVAKAGMAQGHLRITRRGADVAADAVDGGPIRLARGPSFDDAGWDAG